MYLLHTSFKFIYDHGLVYCDWHCCKPFVAMAKNRWISVRVIFGWARKEIIFNLSQTVAWILMLVDLFLFFLWMEPIMHKFLFTVSSCIHVPRAWWPDCFHSLTCICATSNFIFCLDRPGFIFWKIIRLSIFFLIVIIDYLISLRPMWPFSWQCSLNYSLILLKLPES